ncbi:MAG: family 20 glycosylhydrolase [Alistipes sp.]|nr:family 20 glycosylhydrolase [Candidatus Minthomonas equi]
MNKSSALALIISVIVLSGCSRISENNINIIPQPVELTPGRGHFTLDGKVFFSVSSEEAGQTAEFFASKMRKSTGFLLPVKTFSSGKCIELILEPQSNIKAEGYRLSVSSSGVKITASDNAGLFYGMESFMQLLPAQIESPSPVDGIVWKAPSVEVNDYPRFSYRGCHIDPCRYFRPAEWIKKQIDVLALYKINTMHLHLTEDQGWRIEIKKYPKLTELGSKRICEDGKVHGGFYTQEELKDIVAYAADRHIDIIPELEIPGHALGAIHAYPELSCRGAEMPVRQIWGVEDIVMCPGKGLMFDFLKDVIDEMVSIFPSEIFHIGGDECPKEEWKNCPHCQRLIKELGLNEIDDGYTPEQHLQTWIVEYFEKYLAKYGKRIIGWDEILEGDLTQGAMVMSWRGTEGGIYAALKGHDVVMTPSRQGYYLDYYQGDPIVEPLGIGGYAPIEKVYELEPVADTLVKMGCDKFIKGVQGNCWSEYFSTDEIAEYMTYPRILAIAETAWSPAGRKNFEDFCRRLDRDACLRLSAHDIKFHIPQPEQVVSPDSQRGSSCDHVVFTDAVKMIFKTTRPVRMVYTLDGTEPAASSPEYTEPFIFTESSVLKIRSALPSGFMSPVRTINIEKVTLSPAIDIEKANLKNGLSVMMYPGNFPDRARMEASGVIPRRRLITNADSISRLLWSETPNMLNFDTPQYGAVARGYVEVPASGIYYVHSDLEELKVDGAVVISNKGEAKRHSRHDNTVALEKGFHEIELTYIGGITAGVPASWSSDLLRVRPDGAEDFMDVPEENLWYSK